ncbi:Endoglucanase [Dactylellina cionopaga]|nr:Endoglucanase [Dactylellina cionopaga]
MKVELAALIAGGAALASAQQSVWGQCGGIGWTGATTCVSGNYCSALNPYYSQCLPGGPATTAATTASRTTTTASRTTTRSTTTTTRQTTTPVTTTRSTTTSTTTTRSTTPSASPTSGPKKFQYVGVNESGAEFGENVIPGTLGKDYTWPSPSSIDYFVARGLNTFRINTKMERITPPTSGGLTGPFDSAYISGLDTIVNYVTNKGAYAVIDPHGYGRFNGAIITDTNAFKTWWTQLANRYKNNARVIFDTNNEYHDMDQTLVVNLNQAAIDGIRSTGATNTIFVEGNSWTGAWSWVSSGNAGTMINLRDPLNKLVYEMHQYLDSDSSGTNAACVSATILKERITAATNWCLQNNVKCILGEVGAGDNAQCKSAVIDGLTYARDSGAWIGVLWWAAGPWWGNTYFQSIEPPSGLAVNTYAPILQSFAP